jgi:uncharacterized protein YbcC (UPF0753/DUF2309 family)
MTNPAAGADLRALVDEAARPVPLLWPLTTMVAANPLWDLRHLPFTAAIQVARQSLPIRGYPPAALLNQALAAGRITPGDLAAALDRGDPPAAGPAGPAGDTSGTTGPAGGTDGAEDTVRPNATVLESRDQRQGSDLAGHADREVSRWCAAFLARLMPVPDGRADPAVDGFYPAWRAVAGADPVIRSLGMPALIDRLGPDAEQAVASCLDLLGCRGEGRLRELTGQLTRQPGWAGYAKWRSRWAVPDHPAPRLDLMDYLAVRLAYDVGFAGRPARSRRRPAAPARPPADTVPGPTAAIADEGIRVRLARLPAAAAAGVWLAAYENHYRDWLLSALSAVTTGAAVAEPAAQVVCCIDARSEGLRRHLEHLGDYQTFGFAGFFGIPARLRPYGGGEPTDLYPVLISSGLEIGQQPADPALASRALAATADAAAAAGAIAAARKKPVPGYLLAEAGGLALGPVSVLRTVAPRGFTALRRAVARLAAPEPAVLHRLSGPGAPGDGEQADYSEAALRAMGLTERFAPVVVLCGHGSSTENNPYASALDCGACGAARGGASARLAAAVLNRDPVRAALARRGITIPDDTVFVAGEHDTATDLVTVYPPEQRSLTPDQEQRIAAVAADLDRAGAALAAERAVDLPGAGRAGRIGDGRRVGPGSRRARRDSRSLARRHVATRAADWAQVQPEWGLAQNAALIIGLRRLSARADLGRRVFLHSYEPDADPDGTLLGAILAGPMIVAHWISACYYFSTVDPDVLGAGDKVAHNVVGGLAVWQGAGGDLRVGLPRQSVFDRDHAYHEPMRLLVLIDAPLARIDQVIARDQDVAGLVAGEWVRLTARHAGRFWVRDGGDWHPWRPAHEDVATGPAVAAAR